MVINQIPMRQMNFIYMGLPVGDEVCKINYVKKRFDKVEKSFYSLYGLGFKPFGLNPKKIAFIYKTYCQSILKYGLEFINLKNEELMKLNIRQNILIKRAIGLSKYAKTTPLFKCLKKFFYQSKLEKIKLPLRSLIFLKNHMMKKY